MGSPHSKKLDLIRNKNNPFVYPLMGQIFTDLFLKIRQTVQSAKSVDYFG